MNWKLTRDRAGRPEIDDFGDARQLWGCSVLAEMARTDRAMHKVSEGVYEFAKLPGREA